MTGGPYRATDVATGRMSPGPPIDAKHDAEKILPGTASDDSGMAHPSASAPIACRGGPRE